MSSLLFLFKKIRMIDTALITIIIIILHNLTLTTTQLSTTNHPDYELVLKYSILYYEAQKSGKIPLSNRIKWRGDSAINDRGINGEDLSGGYYDGSDFVKFSYPMAYSIIMLSWGVHLYPDIYKSIDEYNAIIDIIKWATEYFIKCHVSPNELYGQVGDFRIDHKYWGRPEEMNMTRPAYKIDETHPGTDLAAEVSAVFSSASLIFNNIDREYAAILLNHSIELYDFARNFRGISKDVIPGAKQFYEEIYFYSDQLIWSALWLFKATNNSKYLHDAKIWYEEFDYDSKVPTYFHFNEQTIGIRLLLSEITKQPKYLNTLKEFCNNAIDSETKTQKGLIFIKKFGVLALAANIAFICLEVAKFERFPKDVYRQFAKSQIDYILGSAGQSYLVGYGSNYPKQPFHSASNLGIMPFSLYSVKTVCTKSAIEIPTSIDAPHHYMTTTTINIHKNFIFPPQQKVGSDFSLDLYILKKLFLSSYLEKSNNYKNNSCPDLPAPCGWNEYRSIEPNPQIVYGALVSGPNLNDEYIDRREDFYFEYNVVGLDFNAGFQNALVALIAVKMNDYKEKINEQNVYEMKISAKNVLNKTNFN